MNIFELIIAGFKRFAGEIFGALFITIALWAFPSLWSIFKYKGHNNKDGTDTVREIQRSIEAQQEHEEQLKKELKAAEAQKAELARQLESERKERERLRSEQAGQIKELQMQIELQRQEHERIKAEIQSRETLTALVKNPPAMTDEEFINLCSSQNVKASEVEEAVKNGANVNARSTGRGDTALMLADRAEIVEVLLRHGADGHAKNKEGNTAMLLNYGAKVNVKDSEGYTPLMNAAMKGSAKLVEMLIIHGANINAKNNLGCTALDCSYSKEAAEILRRYGAG